MQHANATASLDRLGMSASLLCAIHCAVLPAALAILPALGLAWLDSKWADWTMVVLATFVALGAHRKGIALHKRCLPASMAFTGILTIMGAICLLSGSVAHHYIQASGATLVAGSHLLNRRFCRDCQTCRRDSQEELSSSSL
jgi:MerC mercury resistance protein